LTLDFRPRFLKRLLKYLGALVGLLGLLVFGFFWYSGLLGDNFREVIPGKVYRSGQMSGPVFEQRIKENHIQCVINLRGQHAAPWYADEEKACQAAGTKHLNLEIKLGVLPPPEIMKELVSALQSGPYPILVHCHNGADRASLASVLYLNVVEKRPLEQALAEEMTWRQGHLKIGKAESIDRFFELYYRTRNGHDMKDWIEQSYPDVYANEVKK